MEARDNNGLLNSNLHEPIDPETIKQVGGEFLATVVSAFTQGTRPQRALAVNVGTVISRAAKTIETLNAENQELYETAVGLRAQRDLAWRNLDGLVQQLADDAGKGRE